MNLRFIGALAVLLIGFVVGLPSRGEAKPLTVVELFTSQGCSSCPPADAFQGDLAQRDDVLALSFHVDYWDYIGWKDPFSSPEASARQRSYAHYFKTSHVYTPQMVIDGRYGEVGSHRGKVLSRMNASRDFPKADIEITATDERIAIEVGPYAGTIGEEMGVYLVLLDKKHETQVRKGENAGRMLSNFNVVRAVRRIGNWTGEKTSLSVEKAALNGLGDRCAVLLQSSSLGPVLGAAVMDLK